MFSTCSRNDGMITCCKDLYSQSVDFSAVCRLAVYFTDYSVLIVSSAAGAAGPKTWNALPEDVTSSQSEYTFRHQLKTWLFKKSFLDIII